MRVKFILLIEVSLKYSGLIVFVVCFFFYSCKKNQGNSIQETTIQRSSNQHKPNIVLIVADDLGYSDLGCFGSEIATPNIDSLASHGQIFTNFYTAATCSPTRAMLLTGTDNHVAGLGDMSERAEGIPSEKGKPGYEGYLNRRVLSFAQLLKNVGYHTFIAGKWHLGLTADQSPQTKGFERSFTLLDAYANHYYPDPGKTFWEDDHFAHYPGGQYSTDFYTDKLIGFISESHKDISPFFLMATYTSPHWPLQAPPEYIEKYAGVYDSGYDSLRTQRLNGLKKMGLVMPNVTLPELPKVEGNLYDISTRSLLPWKSLTESEQKLESRKMEIYAGMVNNLDHNIGRLIKYLKEIGEYDNTWFVFLSDNAPAELDVNVTPDSNNPYPNMGTANSFVAYGAPWAHASSAVNSLYKGYSAEGGIHSPMIIKMPFQTEGKSVSSVFTTVMDLAPTFLEIAGTTYPSSYSDQPLAPYQGASLLPFLMGQRDFVHDENYVMGWELFGRCAIRKGNWKISKIEPPFGKGIFQLFDLKKDPTESHDLSQQFPDKYKEMLEHWKDYVSDNGVIL